MLKIVTFNLVQRGEEGNVIKRTDSVFFSCNLASQQGFFSAPTFLYSENYRIGEK